MTEIAQIVEEIKPSQVTHSFTVTWWAAPRPPVHPTRMLGRQTFLTPERALRHINNLAADSELVSLTEQVTTEIDRTHQTQALLLALRERLEAEAE